MTFDTRWDVNKYRYPHEVPVYWEMKKKFMLNNKKKFPEDKVVCLAQMFYNIKAMGCRYDPNIMEEINRLSIGIVDDERMNNIRNRQTFVPASDAVHAKVTRQGLSSILGQGQQQYDRQPRRGSNQYISFVKSDDGYGSMGQRYGSTPTIARNGSWRPQQDFDNRYNSYQTSTLGREGDDSMDEMYDGCTYAEEGSTPLQLPRSVATQRRRAPNTVNSVSNKRKSSEMGGGGYTSSSSYSSVSPPKQARRYEEPPPPARANKSSAPPRVEDSDLRRAPLGTQPTPEALPAFFGNILNTQQQPVVSTQQQPIVNTHQQQQGAVNTQQCSGWITPDNRPPRQAPRKIDSLDAKEVMESGPFGRLVVFESNGEKEDSAVSIICRTASAAHVDAQFSFTMDNNTVNCRLMLGGMFLACGKGVSQKVAKEAACTTALQRLRETSFTVKVKAPYVNESNRPVDRSLKRKSSESDWWGTEASVDMPLHEDNIGRKMMKLMGWSGGGLGKNQQGLQEPIRPNDTCINRSGMGITNSQDFRRKVQTLLQDFSRSESKNDLVFSADFTKDERKMIHEMVRKYNLKSRSFGRSEDARHIVVFKKITPQEIVEELIRCGGETDKYVLIPPTAT